MAAQTVGEQVRWQDLKVRSEIDIVLEIARKEGWKDCEVFGYGDMITEPQESKGWKLIPADFYRHSIPPEAIGRLHQIINAGIRVRGVIIADDERRTELTPATAPAPAKPGVSLPALSTVVSGVRTVVSTVISSIGKALHGLIRVAGILALVAGAIALVAGVIALVPHILHALIRVGPGILFVLFLIGIANAGTGTRTGVDYDPKLVVLVDDGKGGTTWVSLFTWYD